MKQGIILLAHLWCCLLTANAAPVVADGIYSISCQQKEGYVALGAYHGMSPYICYVQDGSELTEDAYWVVTNTDNGYTFQNEASGQWLVYTADRVDAYYKYMTLADELPSDGSGHWNISTSDTWLCVQSAAHPTSYWNLRASQGLLGTYIGSSRSDNERYAFTPKSNTPEPEPQPSAEQSFPPALHVYMADGRLEAYPLSLITNRSEQDGQLVIETRMGQTFTYALTDVERVSEDAPTDFPTFVSFKFNNKFNDQLFTDAIGEMVDDTVFVTIAAIGKRLTPSFKLPDDQTQVYVDGEQQNSKVSRLRFDKDIYYVVTRPGITMLLPDDEEGTTYSMQPYGRLVRVHVDWLTDKAEVPAIYIITTDGQDITSKEYYKDATISIDGKGIFPSMADTVVQIKGRGNSSWGWPKKPYRLKFGKKVKPLGMTKGKSWVLLSNYQTGSLMANAIGMKAANLMEASAANHIMPVDLYINGEYRGNYNLTEKVGFSNNSVDLDDESAAALLELDSYYDEPEGQKFRSQPYNLPINVKEPDFSDGTSLITLETVETDFNRFLQTLYDGEDISRHVDLEQLVRFLMVNELILNYEFYHPKSTFCYRESFESDTSKYIFGPVWDLDWAFGYERHKNYFVNEADYNYWTDGPNMEVVDFVRDLRYKYKPLGTLYQALWEQFMQDGLTELMEFCQDYYDFAHTSFESNRSVWGDRTDYSQQAIQAASWLQTRAEQIYSDILDDNKERVSVTYDYVYNGQVIHSETIQAIEGSSMPASPQAGNSFIQLEAVGELPETITADCRATYRVTWNGPFTFTHTLADAHWYNLTIRSQYHVGMDDSEPYYPQIVDDQTLLEPAYQWAFGGDPFHIRIYNRATGLGQVLTLDGAVGNCVNAVMRSGDYSWDIRPNSDGFVLSPHNYPHVCINQIGGSGGPLQTWSDAASPSDNGSTFRILQEYEPDYVLGDANGDGKVTITDAVYVVNYILGQPAADFCEEAADLNGDNNITITDAVMIVNIILGQGQNVKEQNLKELRLKLQHLPEPQ